MNQVLNQPPVSVLPPVETESYINSPVPKNTTSYLSRQSRNLFNSPNSSILGEIEPYYYSYDMIPNDQVKELQNTTTTIRILYRNSLRDLANIGFHLIKTKELLKYGEFEKWVEKEFTQLNYFTLSTAENYMNLARMVDQYGSEKLNKLPLSVIYIISKQEKKVIERVLKESEKGQVTRTRLKEIKKEVLLERPVDQDLFSSSTTVESKVVKDSVSEVVNVAVTSPQPILLPPPILPTKQEVVIDKVEQEEVINYQKIDYLQQTEATFNLILGQLPLKRESIENIEEIFYYFKFAINPDGLLAVYCSPFDIATVFYYANATNFNYITSISVATEPTLYPDYNIKNVHMSVLLFSYQDNFTFKDMTSDYYSSHESFLNAIVNATDTDKSTLFFKSSKCTTDLLDEDLLFKLANITQLTVSV